MGNDDDDEYRCARCNRASGMYGHYLGEDPDDPGGRWACRPEDVREHQAHMIDLIRTGRG